MGVDLERWRYSVWDGKKIVVGFVRMVDWNMIGNYLVQNYLFVVVRDHWRSLLFLGRILWVRILL
jgi:hypothetical protein